MFILGDSKPFFGYKFSHTKNLVTILLAHKMFDGKSDKKKISDAWLKAPAEYCIRLLKMESDKDVDLFLRYSRCST